MPKTRKSPGHVVRPKPRWHTRKVVCVLVFSLTGGLVYWLGSAQGEQSVLGPDYTATARIVIRQRVPEFVPGTQIVDLSPVPVPDGEEVQREITSEASIRRAIDGVRDVQGVRSRLRAAASRTTSPDQLDVSLRYCDADPERAAELVNALAEDLKRQYETRWQERTYSDYVDARRALQRAQAEHSAAESALQRLRQRHLEEDVPGPQWSPPRESRPDGQPTVDATDATDAASESVPRESDRAAQVAADRSRPGQVENPVWLDLNERLTVLRDYRERLLLDRTEQHPEVQKVELDIAELWQRIKAVPRKVPAGPAPGEQPAAEVPDVPSETVHGPPRPQRLPAVEPLDPPATGPPPPDPEAEIAALKAQRQREFARWQQELAEAVERTAQEHSRLALAANRAWQEHRLLPVITIELAQPTAVEGSPPGGGGRLIWAAVLAALVAGAGVGMISTGAAMEPPLTTVAEAQEMLPQPVVGTILETDPTDAPRTARRRTRLVRLAMVVVGMGLMAGWISALIRVL